MAKKKKYVIGVGLGDTKLLAGLLDRASTETRTRELKSQKPRHTQE